MEPLVLQPGGGHLVRIGGFGARLLVSDQLTSSSASLVEHTLAPGLLGAPPHRHRREDELSYVLSGELSVQLGDRVVRAGPGTTVVKPRDQFHAFWNSGVQPVRFLEVIAPAGFERYFVELAQLLAPDGVRVSVPDLDAIDALAARYGMEFDMSNLQGLLRQHGLHMG